MGGGVLEVQGSAIVEFAVTVANVSGNKISLRWRNFSKCTACSLGMVYRFDQSDSSATPDTHLDYQQHKMELITVVLLIQLM